VPRNEMDVPGLRLDRGAELRDALGEWLNGFSWSHWATFTFRVGCPSDCLREHRHERGWGLSGPSSSRAREHVHRFLDEMPRGPGYFYCIERGPWGGRCHGHALLKVRQGPMENSGRSIDEAWTHRYGRVQLRAYDAERGASYYCGKYITKAPLCWDVGGPIVRG